MLTINSISSSNIPASSAAKVQSSHSVGGADSAIKFKAVMQSVREAAPNRADDVYTGLVRMQERILGGEYIKPNELIVYQIKAGEFNLRVELASKVAESVMTTFRKFQNTQ